MSLEAPIVREDSIQKTLLSAELFLGHPNHQVSISRAPLDNVPINTGSRDYIFANRPPREWIGEFIDTVDPWMPFIPIRELQTRFSNECPDLQGDEVLLLACIKLTTEPLPSGDASNKHYLAIKSAFLNAEIDRIPSIRQLQALLFILFYEYGHGMYPSAYMTLGACIRYLAILGIGTETPWVRPTSWMAAESQRRLWWSVYIMER